MKNHIKQGFTLIELLVVITIIAILASLAVPTFSKIQERGNITKAISNCRQVVTSLRIYSSDHDGNYPDVAMSSGGAGGAGGGSGGGAGGGNTANAVLRELFKAASIDNEMVFGCPASRDGNPDGNVGTSPEYSNALQPGENHWAMTAGLTDSASGTYPLVYENPEGGNWPAPTWNADAAGTGVAGRTWGGGKVVIGMNDSSVIQERTTAAKGAGLELAGKANNAPNVFRQNEQSGAGGGGGEAAATFTILMAEKK